MGEPDQRLHLILLGVQSVPRSTAFFDALGWTKASTSHEGFVKFDLGGFALCLIPLADLARDAGEELPPAGKFGGMGLVYLARSPEEVTVVLDRVEQAGGTVTKPATVTPWGVAGYFKDPDGHLFEVDFEEAWVLDADHRLVVEP